MYTFGVATTQMPPYLSKRCQHKIYIIYFQKRWQEESTSTAHLRPNYTYVYSLGCEFQLNTAMEGGRDSAENGKSTTPTQASGYVVLIRWLQSALIPFVTTQSVAEDGGY